MGKVDVHARVRAYIFEKFPLAKSMGLDDRGPLLERGVIDSLGILDLVNHLEQEFGIAVADEEMAPENFQSIEKISVYVGEKLATGAGTQS
jgi:acyl carrier protein